ncbi:MAG: acyl-CoA dehydrogenase family protein [Verrucomicrobiota bacterium]
MDFSWTDAQRARRNQIATFCRETLTPALEARADDRTFAREAWDACADIGLHGRFPSGEDAPETSDALSLILALEAFGHGCPDMGLVFALGAQRLAVTGLIARWGGPAHETLLNDLSRGTRIAASAMTEPSAGSDIASIETNAVPHGDGFRLNGEKAWVTNLPVAETVLVYAVTDPNKGLLGGVTAFLIDGNRPGCSIEERPGQLGHRSAPIGTLRLTDYDVDASAVLGGVGGGLALFNAAMNRERVGLFAAHVGAMERFLETAVAHARTRSVGGRPIGSHQAVSHRLADMKTRLEAARWLVYRAGWQLDRSTGAALDAAMAKLFVSESLLEAATDTMRTFGAAGYFEESGVPAFLRDAVGTVLYSGTSDIQRNIIARWLGL